MTSSRVLALAATASISLVIAACSPPHEVDSTQKVDTAASAAAPTNSAHSSTTASSTATTTTSTGDEVTIALSTTENLSDGQVLSFNVAGLDPTAGYYAAICSADYTGQVPLCTGLQGDTQAQAWLSNNGGTVAISQNGTASVDLVATATGEGIDCTTESCVLKIFGDHRNGFQDVTELPVSFS
ncbi:thiamine biosynthesis protein [Corynebacterium kutscheri]|uniref:Thiamine biosynthesis protein n=1 Tax=Corynebacterium kutscheri TaxID=35755 RepID=A0A0F6TEF8_9CORY|nr:hypothetical protein [Corynebacterium kutscheri]AKE41989.1 hypothetical protein UL82_09245 [Corynebacterium kutscheri]VEH06212.1 thiamine biosynthesis protein [Corynebacterium kutscheri]VEH10330.1 thiamine biosynthesis protein [Corynebacterium kutscheri]VEH82129.1 thiamine biosynthesis protein [Corynebacterium kutscheri]